MPKENSSSARSLSESWHGDAVITQGEGRNSREICLLFGPVAGNANELADSAEKELFSSRQGDLHYWKNRK